MTRTGTFKLTYSTMFSPPPVLHELFDAALASSKSQLGREYPMWIDGKARAAASTFASRSPINRNWELARFALGSRRDAADAIEAAHRAHAGWSRTPWRERVRLLRKVAALIEQRVYEISAAVAAELLQLEVGAGADFVRRG